LNVSAELNLNKPQLAERARVLSLKDEKRALAQLKSSVQDARAKLEREKAERDAQLAKRQGIASAMDQDAIDKFGLDAQGRPTFAWYKHRADRGEAAAEFKVGQFYERGHEVPTDLKEAMRWYRNAANHGHAEAQFYLAMLSYYGINTDRDSTAAHALLKASAEQGHTEARRMLELVDAGQPFLEQSMAVWWLARFGRIENAGSAQHLASMYQQGRGTTVSGLDRAMNPTQVESTNILPSQAVQSDATPHVATEIANTRKQQPQNPPQRRSNNSTAQEKDGQGEDPTQADGSRRWISVAMFIFVAMIPIGAFGWFVRKEQQRLVQLAKAKKATISKRFSPHPKEADIKGSASARAVHYE
jgi:hypothetical protein